MNEATNAGPGKNFVSTRIRKDPGDVIEPEKPRIGRRESEPHSDIVSYIHDVLQTNFPDDSATWDLHHYFVINGDEIDLQLDVSWFKGLQIEHTLSSYRATEHENQVPVLAINILSKSTWHDDVGEHVDECRLVGIPVYVIFAPYDIGSRLYKPPFLRAYMMTEHGEYSFRELRKITAQEGGEVDWDAVVDVGDRVPFQFGVMELARKHERGLALYRLLLLDAHEKRIFASQPEQEKTHANEAEARAEEAEARAEEAEARAEQEKNRADKLLEELENLKQSMQ